MLLGPSLSGVDQVGRSGGLIQTRRLTCEVASLDRAGGSAAPYLSPESAEEALPGPTALGSLRQEPPHGSDDTTNTAPEALQLALLFNGECCRTVTFSDPRLAAGVAAGRRLRRGCGSRTPRPSVRRAVPPAPCLPGPGGGLREPQQQPASSSRTRRRRGWRHWARKLRPRCLGLIRYLLLLPGNDSSPL